jgi:hypothetical protein
VLSANAIEFFKEQSKDKVSRGEAARNPLGSKGLLSGSGSIPDFGMRRSLSIGIADGLRLTAIAGEACFRIPTTIVENVSN